MSQSEILLWGVAGSLAVELVTILKYYNRGHFPTRYRRCGFWLARLLLALVGGGLAVAYAVTTKLLAANIGASAPLILMSLSQGLKEE